MESVGVGVLIPSGELARIQIGNRIIAAAPALLSPLNLALGFLTLQGDTRTGQQWQRNQDKRGQKLERDLLKAHNDMLNNSGVNNQGFPNDPNGFVPEGTALLFGALKAIDLYVNWTSIVTPDSMPETPDKDVHDSTLIIRTIRPTWKP